MRRAVRCNLLENLLPECGQHDGCLLVQLLANLRAVGCATQQEGQERTELCSAIDRLLVQGYTLRTHFPNVPVDVQEEWLGRRLVLGHARWFLADSSWTSIVSSRLGRYGRSLGDWPVLLELLLRSIQRSGALYLAVADTTVASLVEPLLACSAVPYVRVRLPAANETEVAAWLATKLSFINDQRDHRELHISPELLGSPGPSEGTLHHYPLQDRVAIGCAQRVRALIVRPGGTIARLLAVRLADPRLGSGTVSIWMPSMSMSEGAAPRDGVPVKRIDQHAWLDRGAVGWYVAPREPQRAARACRKRRLDEAPLWQLTCKYALCCSSHASPELEQPEGELPRYLVHCVRGAPGALPPEAAMDFIAQMWLAGRVPEESPLATLATILESGTLRGRSALNRTDEPCVSFSGVPLDELAGRRTFQPHLGRWDWEPFGLMIERRALEQLGARPVIYGDAETHRQLSTNQRPLFQPAKRRRRAGFPFGDWQEEREWRCVGDVRLSDLPRSAVHVFVAYAHQAQALACHSAWPVIWLQDAQTLARPAGSKPRPRTEVRTSRN